MKEGWEIKKIEEISTVNPPKKDVLSTIKSDCLGSFLPMEDLGVNAYYTTPKQQRPLSEVQSSYTCFIDGDILLAKVSPCFENGKIGIADNLVNGIGFGSSEYLVIRSKENVRKGYLYHYLRSNHFVREATKNLTGTSGLRRVSKSFVGNYPIPIPPLAEQESIVAELDCLLDIIEKQKQQLKELDNLAKSIFYTTFGDPISNNFGWKNRRLGEIVNSNMIGLTRSGSEQDASYEYLYFKMNNIGNEGGVDWSKTTRVNACAQEVEKYTLKEGDFLFNTRNSFELVGKTCIYPHIDGEVCLFNNNIMRIDFKKEINVTYMAYLFQDKYIKNQLDRIKKGTTSVWAIYYKDLEKIDILVPDIALQEEFASKIAAIEKQKDMIKQSIAETETLFNSRMDYYFN